MKLHIISDLHNEFSIYQPSAVANSADVIILAGDIWKNASGIGWARETWPDHPIIYIAGNHEFYGRVRLDVLAKLRIEAKACDVHFLDDEEVIIDDTRFLGATLWTDFKLFGEDRRLECMSAGQHSLNDFKVIHEGRRHFSPMDSVVLHEKSLAWLSAKLDTHFAGQTVVVTHHLPSAQSVVDRFKTDELSACFASNLDYLMDGSKAQLWVHGHTHDNLDYTINGTRVLCNPRGYFLSGNCENKTFNADLVAEVTSAGVELVSDNGSKYKP